MTPFSSTSFSPTSLPERLSPPGFEYPIQVYPHQTDYAGVVWHGCYVAWMEEVRIQYLQQCWGLNYAELVAADWELPVVDLSIRYHRKVHLGMNLVWQAWVHPLQGVRSVWDYELRSIDQTLLYVTAQVTLVPVNRHTGKILRQLPPQLAEVLGKV